MIVDSYKKQAPINFRLLGLFILLIGIPFFMGCCSGDSDSSESFENQDSQDDDDPAGICDFDATTANDSEFTAENVVSITVEDPPNGNPLCRKIVVKTTEPISLTGFAVTENETGYSPSVPLISDEGTEHVFWFYGLLEEKEFAYYFAAKGEKDTVVAYGCFDVPSVGWLVSGIEKLLPDLSSEYTDWFMVYQQYNMQGQKYRFNYLYDRQGRLRFYHVYEAGYYLFSQVMSNGDIVSTTHTGIIGVRPDGSEYEMFDIQLNKPYLRETHHKPYIKDWDTDFAIVIYALTGPGVECDLITPTEQAVGDGIAIVDKNGFETWRWNPFDFLDLIPPDAMGTAVCEDYFWGEDRTDWTHGNSVMPVPGEDAYILSMRNVDRIVRINGTTGEIDWQLGEGLDFQWIGNEPDHEKWFHMQHDAKFYPDGRFTVYDNSFYVSANWSRALELAVNQDNMTVEKVWEYRVPHHAIQGNVELHYNGNMLIGAGNSRWLVEVPPNGGPGDEIFMMRFSEGVVRAEYYPAMWVYEDPPNLELE